MTDEIDNTARLARHWRVWIAISLWLAAIGVAGLYDAKIAGWVHAHDVDEFMRSHRALREALKVLGFYPFTMALALVVWLTHRHNWRAAVFLLVATALSGVR